MQTVVKTYEFKGVKIVLDASGDVEVKGANVKGEALSALTLEGATAELKAKAKGTVQAGAILEVKGAVVKIN